MKNYTDIEQSKKLSEILPLESFDAFYSWRELMKDYDFLYVPEKMLTSDLGEDDIPAWSLATLLNILPNEIITNNMFECHYQIDIRKYDGGNNTTLYQIAYGNNRGLSGSWHDMINTGEKESLIDCCVQMIIILHRFKKL